MLLENLPIHRFTMPGIESNMYLITEDDSALIIDPNVNAEALSFLQDEGVKDITVLLTHEHYDHISGVNRVRELFPSVEVLASETSGEAVFNPNKNMARFWEILVMDMPKEKKEAAMDVADANYSCFVDKCFSEDEVFYWNNHEIQVKMAPGHSPGGMLIFLDGLLFSGDNLVNGSGVISRLPGGSWKIYCEQTRPIIENLPDDTWILPGHGEPARLSEMRKYLNKFGKV